MFLTAPPLLGREAREVAILGNAGGTTARAFGVYYPEARIDGVEIDGAVSDVGRAWFGLGDNPRLTVHAADARPFLRATDRRYDLILIDAYRQPYVPFYLATREFFAEALDRLAPDGVIALNVSTVPGDDRLAQGIAGTLADVFPQVITWQALRFNQFVVGCATPQPLEVLRARLLDAPDDLLPDTRLFAAGLRPAAPAARPWTDDRAPVEWITDRMIAAYAMRGVDEAERAPPHGAGLSPAPRALRVAPASSDRARPGFSGGRGRKVSHRCVARLRGALVLASPFGPTGGAHGGTAAVPRRSREAGRGRRRDRPRGRDRHLLGTSVQGGASHRYRGRCPEGDRRPHRGDLHRLHGAGRPRERRETRAAKATATSTSSAPTRTSSASSRSRASTASSASTRRGTRPSRRPASERHRGATPAQTAGPRGGRRGVHT